MPRSDQISTNSRHRARSPAELNHLEWWSICIRVAKKAEQYDISMLAAAVAFYSMLAIFPALAVIVTLYALFSDPVDVADHLAALEKILPAEVSSTINDQLQSIIGSEQNALGLGFVFSLVFTLWSARRGVLALIKAITIVYRESEQRNSLYLTLYSLSLTLGGIILVLCAMFVMLALTPLLRFIPIPDWQSTITALLSWGALIAMLVTALSYLYRLSPPRRYAKWRWLSPGALLATVLWFSSSFLFSLYAGSIGNYNETYGALGAAVVLLLWFFLTSLSIILGALLNAEMEIQTSVDTTVGTDRPMGQRGAVVADTPPAESE